MNCPHCQADVLASQAYCGQCGQVLTHEELTTSEASKPLGIARPVFIHWVFLARLLPTALRFAVGLGIVIGLLAHGYTIVEGGQLPLLSPFLVPFFLILIGILLTGWLIRLRNYQETRYIFFSEHLEYYDGFWNIQRKDVRYKNITQMELHRSVIQRIYGLGTLNLTVPGFTKAVALADLKDPERVYHNIQRLIDAAVKAG